MTPLLAEHLLAKLRQGALGLDELHERIRVSGSTWTRAQLELFLLCALAVTRDVAGAFRASATSTDDDLHQAIVAAVRSFSGRPVPAAQIRARLPSHFVTTDEQIRAIAKRSPEVQLVGPGLIQTRKG